MSQSHHGIQSYVFVGVQFICLGWMFATGPWVAKTPELFLIEMLGGVLGMWALWTMKPRHLSALPEIKPQSPLQTGGPYRWIRHPMYTAVLLFTLALVVEEFSPLRWMVWCILVVDLYLKLQYEEKLLMKAFPDYRYYQAHSHKLIPWIV